MSAHWTVRAEYDYVNLGNSGVGAPSPSVTTVPAAGGAVEAFQVVPGTNVAQQIHAFKLAVNYKFGPDGSPFPDSFGWPAVGQQAYTGKAAIYKAPPATVWAPGWEVEGGARYWYSSGQFQKDMAPDNLGPQNPTLNISRLTWDNIKGNAAEVFLRVDAPSNWFVKGIVGGGKLSGGKINDEDWGLGTPFTAVNTGYSNTEGNASGVFSYATADIGYNVFRGAYKVGVFAGYNIYTDNKTSSTCVQIALPASGICSPPINLFILGEDDRWQSLRIGANAEVMLAPRWKLVADVAYLPYVRFDGQDYHPLRPFLAEEWGTGVGTQVEAFLYYYVTPQFSIGAGGRYWAMWTTSGADCREPPNGACPAPLQNVQYKTERFGMLFQAAYKFDQPAPTLVTK